MTTEQWRPVVGYEGRYEVSSLGRVRSVDHWSRNGAGPFLRRGRLLKPTRPSKGYSMIDLRRGTRHSGGGRNRTVHTVVMEAFVGPPPDGMEVLHGNGNKLDKCLANLRYGTRSENIADAIRHGDHFGASKTHCSRNHEYTPENTYMGKRGNGKTFRMCRICTRERTNAWAEKRKLESIGAQARGEGPLRRAI